MLGAARGVPGGGAAVSEMAQTALDLFEDSQRNKRVHYSLQLRADELILLQEAKRQIIRGDVHAYHHIPEYRKAYRLLFEPNLQMNPLSTQEEMLSSHPQVVEALNLRTVLTNQENQKELLGVVTVKLALLSEEQHKKLGDIEKNVKSIGDVLDEMRHTAAQRMADRTKAEEDRVRIAGMKSIVFLASTLVGFKDPDAGRAIQTISDAGFKIYEAIVAFNGLSQTGGWASAVLTGDIVGAILPVLALVIDTGPSAEEIIIEELGHLREQVSAVRQQMHERFDLVDARLVKIHDTMIDGLSSISKQIGVNQEDLIEHLVQVRRTLREHDAKLDDLYHTTVERTQAIRELIVHFAISHCVRQRGEWPTTGITETEFRSCLNAIRTLALDGLENAQITLPKSPLTIAQTLRDYPDEATKAVAQEFRSRSGNSYLPEQVVGPQSWAYVARTHDEFLNHWPEFAMGTNSAAYARRMNDYRDNLNDYIKAISNDLASYAKTGETEVPTTALGTLIHEVREKKGALEHAMNSAMRELGRDDRTVGLRLGDHWRDDRTVGLRFGDRWNRGDWQSFRPDVFEAILWVELEEEEERMKECGSECKINRRIDHLVRGCTNDELHEVGDPSRLRYWLDPHRFHSEEIVREKGA